MDESRGERKQRIDSEKEAQIAAAKAADDAVTERAWIIACVCHEANRAYCLRALGDDSQPAWEHAPEWQQASALAGAKHHIYNPEISPEHSHDLWMTHKLAEGWTYGPVKDVEKKQHPCIVPYSELPEGQQRKDALFAAIARALA